MQCHQSGLHWYPGIGEEGLSSGAAQLSEHGDSSAWLHAYQRQGTALLGAWKHVQWIWALKVFMNMHESSFRCQKKCQLRLAKHSDFQLLLVALFWGILASFHSKPISHFLCVSFLHILWVPIHFQCINYFNCKLLHSGVVSNCSYAKHFVIEPEQIKKKKLLKLEEIGNDLYKVLVMRN